jgi:hypothetical protein
MSKEQELQAQLLIVKAKAYDDREAAVAVETALRQALNNISQALGYTKDDPVTVQDMITAINSLYQRNAENEIELNRLHNEVARLLAVPAVIVHEDDEAA